MELSLPVIMAARANLRNDAKVFGVDAVGKKI
jgi:hypothetical protein